MTYYLLNTCVYNLISSTLLYDYIHFSKLTSLNDVKIGIHLNIDKPFSGNHFCVFLTPVCEA